MSGPADGDDGTDDATLIDPGGNDGDATGDRSVPDGDSGAGPIQRWEGVTLVRVVLAVTLLALVARLAFLGARPAHWDEARVAYWAYFYGETGSLGYHWEEHGPLVQIAARWLFEPLGVTDTAARLPVAIVGGLLPLGALLYREHLRDSETVALALFLGFNSVLLYYSRFMRSDVLVAAFMFVALGMLVRFADSRRWRYLYGAALFIALGFGSKENALVYVATWLGAALLVADQWLHSPDSDGSGLARLRAAWPGRWWQRLVRRLARWWGHVAALRTVPESGTERLRSRIGSPRAVAWRALRGVARVTGVLVVALGTAVFVFADRGEGVNGRRPFLEESSGQITLGGALGSPGQFPAFVSDTLHGASDGYGDWFAKSSERTVETYVEFLDGFLSVLAANATVLVAFAVAGIVLERYGREHPRWVVMFLSYCGVASILGYPLGTDVTGAWAWVASHIVVPLSVPAAVGVSWVYREVLTARADGDTLAAVGIAVVLVLAAATAGLTAVNDVYRHPQADDNELVQYAQPHDDLDPVIDTLERASDTDGPTAVVYYGPDGDSFDQGTALVSQPNATAFWDVRPTCTVWSNMQPMNWYFAVADATVDCERSAADLAAAVDENPPPVIFAVPDDGTVPAAAIEESYEKEVYYTRTIGRELVVYTHESWT